VDLHISETYAEDLHIEGGELIHLPRLEHLYIDEAPLLTILETPVLQRLAIKTWRGDHSDSSRSANLHDAHIITAFLRRLGIKLTTLTIDGGYAIPTEEILLLMPEVDTLALCGVRGIADVFKWLAGIGMRELPFINLLVIWSFNMYDKDLYRTDVGALHDMVARRNPPGERYPRPKEIVIQSREDDDTVAMHLKSLCRDRGIRFMFCHEMYTMAQGIYGSDY
jgi:hypothetical protein